MPESLRDPHPPERHHEPEPGPPPMIVGVDGSESSVAALRYFRTATPTPTSPPESVWVRVTAPVLGAVMLSAVLVVTVYNSSAVLGTNSSSPLTVLLPGIVALFAVIGLGWGTILQRVRPAVYQNIGAGQTKPLAVLSHAFAGEEI